MTKTNLLKPMLSSDLVPFCLCVDCYGTALGEGKPLDRIGSEWQFDSDSDLEPHFVGGGYPSCDGCDTRLGGDRYDVHGWKTNWVLEAWRSRC
jgi:hypothetical protein